jgi:hypothetical protein
MKSACFLFWALTAAAQSDPTGSVSGTVTDAVTHMPVKKTLVSANPMGFNGRPQGGASAMTDAGGAFTLTNLQAGKYRLMFQQQNYPQARFGGVVKTIEVKAGETAGPVNVELVPGAAVSGQIMDEDGDPLPNCYVQLHPAKRPEDGVQMMGSSSSNQDGEYRAFGIAPGKYILSAQCQRAVFQVRPFSAGPDPPPSKAYRMQYYPLTIDATSAQVVELTAGNEKPGVDFQMTPTAVTQVRGAFAPGGPDWRNAGHLMLQLNSLQRGNRNGGNNLGAALNRETGTFEIHPVFPGSYVLVAVSNGEENRIGAVQRIEVSDKRVDVMLELKRAIDLSGKVEIESGGNSNFKITPAQINIQLIPEYQVGVSYPTGQVSDDGTFTMKGVLPALWRLQLNAPDCFIKAAWLGSTDVTNAAIDLSGGAVGTLKIVVSTNTATIRGSAPAGEQIFAWRTEDDTPFQGNRNRGTQVDQNGQYQIRGLQPGTYRLVMVPSGGPIPDEGGQIVTVREGETASADVKAPTVP